MRRLHPKGLLILRYDVDATEEVGITARRGQVLFWHGDRVPEDSPGGEVWNGDDVNRNAYLVSRSSAELFTRAELDAAPAGTLQRLETIAQTMSTKSQQIYCSIVGLLGRGRRTFPSRAGGRLISDDQAEFVEIVKDRRDEAARRPFKLNDLRAVFRASDDEWKSLVMFGLHTGQRLGDTASLRCSNLDLQRRTRPPLCRWCV